MNPRSPTGSAASRLVSSLTIALVSALLALGGELPEIFPQDAAPGEPHVVYVSESAREIQVRRRGALDAPLWAYVRPRNGSARNGLDFRDFETGIDFAAGSATAIVRGQIIDDYWREDVESFFLNFYEAGDSAEIFSTIEVRIVSDDTADQPLNPLGVEALCFDFPGHENLKSFAPAPDRKLFVVSGTAHIAAGQTLQKYFLNGERDQSFQTFRGPSRLGKAFPLDDGACFIPRQIDGSSMFELWRLKPDGTIDPAHRVITVWREVADLKLAPDGTIYLLHRDSQLRGSVARLNSDGSLDTTFLGVAGYSDVTEFEMTTRGELFVTGSVGGTHGRMSKLARDGGIDRNFAVAGVVTRIEAFGDNLFVAVYEGAAPGRFVRILPSGAIDPGFRPIPIEAFTPFPVRDSAGRFYNRERFIISDWVVGWRLRRHLASGELDPSYPEGTFSISAFPTLIGADAAAMYYHDEWRPRIEVNGIPYQCASGKHPLVRIPFEPAPMRIILAPHDVVPESALNFFLESASNPRITIARTGANSQALTLRYRTRADSAEAGSDFAHIEASTEFAPGQTRMAIPVAIVNDRIPEPREQFYLEFFAMDGLALGAVAIKIGNDDRGLAIARATRLANGRLRIPIASHASAPVAIYTSVDLQQWSEHPTAQIDGSQIIEIDTTGPARFFAAPNLPETGEIPLD